MVECSSGTSSRPASRAQPWCGYVEGLYYGPARGPRDHAGVGYLAETTADEVHDDGWTTQREWFVVAEGPQVLGTVSMVRPTTSLPTTEAFDLVPARDPRMQQAWETRRIVEISAFAVDATHERARLVGALLYKVLWQAHRWRADHDMWLMSMSLDRLHRATRHFPLPIELLSDVVHHSRRPSVACVVDVRLARAAMVLRTPLYLEWLDRLDDVEPAGLGRSA